MADAFVSLIKPEKSSSDSQQDDEVLNKVLRVLIDSFDFFKQAELLTDSNEMRDVFLYCAIERKKSHDYIFNLLTVRKVIPSHSGTLQGEVRKLYMECISLLSDDSSRLGTQMVYHERRNIKCLDDLIGAASNAFIGQLIKTLICQMEQSIAIIEQRTKAHNSDELH